MIIKATTKPVEVEIIKWTGYNFGRLTEILGDYISLDEKRNILHVPPMYNIRGERYIVYIPNKGVVEIITEEQLHKKYDITPSQ